MSVKFTLLLVSFVDTSVEHKKHFILPECVVTHGICLMHYSLPVTLMYVSSRNEE